MIYMICNPYAEKPFPKILIDNKPLTTNSSLARAENKPLKDSLSPSINWKGFFQTLQSSLGLDNLTIKFSGSAEDFQLLTDAYNSFIAINAGMKVDFVVDSELANDISPAFRKNFLFNKLTWFNKEWWGKNKFYDDALKKCMEILSQENISDAEKVLLCKSVLEEYFRKHFQTDKNKLRTHIEHLNQIRAEKFENGQQLSLAEARHRHQFLVDFCVHLERVAPHIAQKISSEFEQINWPSPDFSLAKTEIEGMEGYWLEETDASIFEEKFSLEVRVSYNDFETTCNGIWSQEVWKHAESCYNYSDAYLNKWASRFHDCNVWFRTFFFAVNQTNCTVTNHVPAYWRGQKARQITRTYVEVVKYETDFLNAVQAAVSKKVEEFLPNVLSVSDSWKKDLRDYQEILRRLEEAEEFSCQLEELREITERLTSIKCKIEERK